MLVSLIRTSGLVLIIGFSLASIFLHFFENNLRRNDLHPTVRALLDYPAYFENKFYDFRMSLTLDKHVASKDIVLAAIDDVALQKIGRFPWPRKEWAKLVKKMKHYGAKIVALDVLFPEPEISCGDNSPDIIFADSLKDFQAQDGKRVIVAYDLNSMDKYFDNQSYKEIPEDMYNFVMDSQQEGELGLAQKRISSTTYPIPQLMAAEIGVGFLSTVEDIDGLFRRYPLVANIDTLYFPSFAAIAYQFFTGDVPKLVIDGEGSALMKLKTGEFELNSAGESKVRWIGGAEDQVFEGVSLGRVIEADLEDPQLHRFFKEKLVFVGSTAVAAHDLRHTPVDAKMPGVFIHMNMTQMMLDGRFHKPLEESLKFTMILFLVATVIVIALSFLQNVIFDLSALIVLGGALFFYDTYYLLPQGYQIYLFFTLLSVVGCNSWNTVINFYFASKDKKFLKSAFGNYISPELIDQMYKSGEPPRLGGEVGVRTAFFTDIQGFSSFSEKLSAPQLVELLNEYLTAMTDILLDESGTLDKYEGDAIIAFFGAPMPLEDHARCACRTAIAMQASLLELRKKWVAEDDKWPTIVHEMRMRIGINSGEIVTGNMGSRSRMNYTMMGDSVNLAARLEEAAKQYGVFTQISEATLELTGDVFDVRILDKVRVVGKSEPVTTFELLGEKGKTDDLLVKLSDTFQKGFDLYQAQKWDEAIAQFQESLELEYQRFPELKGKKTNPSLVYMDRCKSFKENSPGEDWDGVYTLTSK